MSTRASVLIVAAALLLTAGAARAGQAEVGIDFFYGQLAPYGEWVTVPPYGWVWCPYDVEAGWRPYWDGDWVYSDFGWTFVSPVEWGWAVYHYGRWGFRDDFGWFWVPGSVWGPSWVSWRHGDGIIGWAPLPPEVGWSFEFGLDWGGLDPDLGIGWAYWSFCVVGRFTDRDVRRRVFDTARNVTLIRSTRNVTRYSTVGNRIVNDNIELSQMEKESGRRIPRYTIVEQQANERSHTARLRGTEVRIFRPRILAEASQGAPRNILPARRFGGSLNDLTGLQQKEKARLEEHNKAERDAVIKRHQKEASLAGSLEQDMKARHQEEIKALEEKQKKEKQALENRHKREQDTYQNQPRNEGGSRKPRKK